MTVSTSWPNPVNGQSLKTPLHLDFGMIFRRFYNLHLRYPLWRLANPTQPYEQYYADVIGTKVARHGHHPVIGQHARAIRSSTELLDLMKSHGLQQHHRFIDYGCGSLRLGKAVLEYLDAGNFRGMDVTQYFLDLGAEYVGNDLHQSKKPVLAVINAENLASAQASQPDYIASWHVCSKIPDGEVDRYFGSIIGLMSPTTQAFIQFPQMANRVRMNSLNWSFSKDQFAVIIARLAPTLQVAFFDITPQNANGVTETYAHLHY
jgi:hypothetical protein